MVHQMSSLKVVAFFLSVSWALKLPRVAEPEIGGSFANLKQGLSLPAKRVPSTESGYDRLQAEVEYLAERYGFEPPQQYLIKRTTGPGGSPAAPINRAQYNIQVDIAGQYVNVNPDLGSPLLWVPTPSAAGNRGNPYSYDPTKSSTSNCLKQSSWNITYGISGNGASFSGQVCYDYVSFPSTPNTKHYGSVFIANYSKSLANNGIFGLAHDPTDGYYNNDQKVNIPTFSQSIIPELPQPLFTMDLQYDSSGSVDFGFINSTRNTTAVTYVPRATDTQSWKITSQGLLITGPSSYYNSSLTTPFIMDSGAQFTWMQKDIVTQFYSGVTGATYRSNGWSFPCNSTLPSIVLYFNHLSTNAYLRGDYLIDSKNSDGTCLGSVQNTPTTDGVSFFGTSFIRTSFFVFLNSSSTYPQGAVGIARKNLPQPPAP